MSKELEIALDAIPLGIGFYTDKEKLTYCNYLFEAYILTYLRHVRKDGKRLKQIIARVLSEKKAFNEPRVRIEIFKKRRKEITYWDITYFPVERRRIRGVIILAVEVSGKALLERKLTEQRAALEAMRVEKGILEEFKDFAIKREIEYMKLKRRVKRVGKKKS